MKRYFLKKQTCPPADVRSSVNQMIAATRSDLLSGCILKGLALSRLPCHLLEGSSHLSVKDGLVMKCVCVMREVDIESEPAGTDAGGSLQWWMFLFRLW